MGIDWTLLTKAVDYYKRNGGKPDARLSEFMDARLAEYYDDLCEKAATERAIPLLQRFLRQGIEGRSDLKNMSSVFNFLIDLTEYSLSEITFKGDKAIKKYLIEGEELTMARKYNNDWYLKSIDSVIEMIEKSASYLYSILDRLKEPAHGDALALISKYEALRDRIALLKDAMPESQLAIVGEIKKVMYLIKHERQNLIIKNFYPSLRATTKENIFLQAENCLKDAEKYLENPPKGAKIPSEKEVVLSMLLPIRDEQFDRLINLQEYRDHCRAMRDGIEEDLANREEALKKQEEDLADAEKRFADIQQKKQDLLRRYQNGLVSKTQLDREVRSIKMNEDGVKAILARRGEYYRAMEMKFISQKQAWEANVRESVRWMIDDSVEDVRLIEYFDRINEVLKRFRGYINGVEGENGENFDFSAYERLLSDTTAALRQDIEEARVLTSAPIGEVAPIFGDEEKEELDSLAYLQQIDPDFATSPTEAIRPEGSRDANDRPSALVEEDMTDADHPLHNIFGNNDDE